MTTSGQASSEKPNRLAVLAVLGLGAAVHWFWAANLPLTNDEAYYWDWGRALDLSFLDHPPAVAWMTWLGSRLATGLIAPRLLAPVLHVLAVWVMMCCGRRNPRAQDLANGGADWAIVGLGFLVPVFGGEGVVQLPDTSLLLALALVLWSYLELARVLAAEECAGGAVLWARAMAFGTAVGLAGNCKYLAAPLALGLGLGLGIDGRRAATEPAISWSATRRSLGPLFLAAATALLVMTPVWVWNARHGWASIRFQGDHGLGGLSLDALAAGRFIVGSVVLLTPALFFAGLGVSAHTLRRMRSQAMNGPMAATMPVGPCLAFACLVVPLLMLSAGKQFLPHWSAPAFWLLVPFLPAWWRRRSDGRGRRWWLRVNAVFAVVLAGVLPWVLVLAASRAALQQALGDDPGALAELTLWEPVAAVLSADPEVQSWMTTPSPRAMGGGDCQLGSTPVLASLRWFWSAQLAFHLPGQPKVYNFDFNHLSYYSYRDELTALADCAVVVVGDQRHLDRTLLAQAVQVQSERVLVVPGHAKTALVVLRGVMRSRSALAAVPEPKATFR